ncbi:MAG: hypothetical protein Q8O14_02915 [bacterium]|nr:hypothetical protein [bacterium]
MRGPTHHAESHPRYAELHYTPLGKSLSRLWQPWPEIYLDLPWRITAGRPLPLLLAFADAHRFPVRLLALELTLADPRGRLTQQRRDLDIRLETPVGGLVLLELELEDPGTWELWADLRAERLPGPGGAAGQEILFRNHLARGLPEEPLRVRVDRTPPPLLPGMVQGDPHVHSSATRDMIEFGPPPELLRRAARALDLDWFALTDHSYDLDDGVENPRRADPALPIWRRQQEWLAAAAATPGPFVMGGEECSVGGVGGGILHLLLLAPDRFWPGSADGGESWLPRRPEWRLPALLEALAGSGCLPVSAHTGERPGAGERWLLRRRSWRGEDMALLTAHQVLSGGLGAAFRAGRRLWLEQLARGRPAVILAGGDSHGHFSLGRSVHVPAWSLGWGRSQLFGRHRSACLLAAGEALAPPASDQPDQRPRRLLAELEAGRTLLTDGPLLWFTGGGQTCLGGILAGGGSHLHVRLRDDAGPLRWLRLWGGAAAGETLLAEWRKLPPTAELPLSSAWRAHRWLRAELRQADGFAMTNAVRPD